MVAIGLNSPRISVGASGFMSHMSRWLGPPLRNRITQASAFGRIPPASHRACDSNKPRQRDAEQSEPADLQHVPACKPPTALMQAVGHRGRLSRSFLRAVGDHFNSLCARPTRW